jgi:hypothetical protein
MTRIIRTYKELIQIDSFQNRLEYLKLDGVVGKETFGFERYLNQKFYKSPEWKRIRDEIIVRDHGCDLACAGYEIYDKIYIHHMNPILSNDIIDSTEYLLNPNYLITTTHRTHNAIHYGDISNICVEIVERKPNDTCPWRI